MSSRTVSARAALPAILAASLLTLVACSGSGGGKNASDGEGPLSEYLSSLSSAETESEEFYERINAKREELVAECMAGEGFDYQPNSQNGGMSALGDDGIEWGSLEFAEQYGYGIVDWPGLAEMEQQSEEYVDPNQGYVESLSESEQQAYYEALSGPQPSEEDMAAMEDGTYEWDWAQSGCYGAADHEVQDEYGSAMAAYEDPEFAELFESMNAVWSELYNYDDPGAPSPNDDVAKLDREWSECMADAGYTDLVSPQTAMDGLNEEWNTLQTPPEGTGDDLAGWSGPSDRQKSEFQQREIEMAVTDWKCKDGIDYEQQVRTVQFDLEQRFVDEHRAELDALIAKHGADQKKS